ncbi:MAG: hypothetical protein ACM338_10470 [Betaproteobacteria bacterium]
MSTFRTFATTATSTAPAATAVATLLALAGRGRRLGGDGFGGRHRDHRSLGGSSCGRGFARRTQLPLLRLALARRPAPFLALALLGLPPFGRRARALRFDRAVRGAAPFAAPLVAPFAFRPPLVATSLGFALTLAPAFAALNTLAALPAVARSLALARRTLFAGAARCRRGGRVGCGTT